MLNEAPAVMPKQEDRSLALQELTDGEFARLSEFVYGRIGITLPSAKKTMLQARLQKRLRVLEMKNFREYVTFLFSPEGAEREMGEFINAVTTNTTDFFREPHHFEYLASTALPMLERSRLLRQDRVRVWSAACSSGQEPYTLAMLLADYAEDRPHLLWSVLGTDISTRVLEKAVKGVYRQEDAEPIPMEYKKKYLLKSKDPSKALVKIVPQLRESVEFRRLNLMDESYGIEDRFEVIFCRNVIIYFDKPTQAALLRHLVNYLVPGGYLFLGHSETLSGIPLPVDTVAATIYRKRG